MELNPAEMTQKGSVIHLLKCLLYISLWYVGTVVYNLVNKRLLLVLPFPATLCTLELGVAVPFILASWYWHFGGLPPFPSRLSSMFVLISLLHALGKYFTALSLISGAVSFVHIVKASEPVFSAGFSFVITRRVFPLPVYLSLAPIIGGVCFASLQDLSFSVSSFSAALLSNTFYQLRVVLFKKFILSPEMTDQHTTSIDNNVSNSSSIGFGRNKVGRCKSEGAQLWVHSSPSMSYRVMTVLAFLLLIPITLLIEGGGFLFALRVLHLTEHRASHKETESGSDIVSSSLEDTNVTVQQMVFDILLAGVSYFIYNEASFLFLDLIHPVTHAVTNALKRVVVIVASVVVFRTSLSTQVQAGSALAIAGTLTYSLLQYHYNHKAAVTSN